MLQYHKTYISACDTKIFNLFLALLTLMALQEHSNLQCKN